MKRNKLRILAVMVALCLLTACGGSGTSGGQGTPPPQAPASSATNENQQGADSSSSTSPAPSRPASSSSSASSSASSLDLSLYPLADPNMMMQGKTWTYVFRAEANGEVLHAVAMADEVVPDNPPAYEHYTKQFPFDYQVSTYVWDGQNLRCKRKGQLNAVQEADLVEKPGYKFVCEIDWFYDLAQVGTAVDESTGETYLGWIPNDLVEDAVKEMSEYHDGVVSFDKIPKGIFNKYFVSTCCYFNGKFYKSIS